MEQTHSWQKDPPLFCLSLPSFLKNFAQPIQPYLPLSLLPCFFDWMDDRATSDVLFYLMTLLIFIYQALAPEYHKDLAVCFMQQHVSLMRSNAWPGFLLVLWFDIIHAHARMHARTHRQTHRHTDTNTQTHRHTDTQRHTQTQTQTQTHTHTHTHAHIRTYVRSIHRGQ